MKPSYHWNTQPNISSHPGWELRTKLIFLCQWLSVMEKILYIQSGAFSLRPTQAEMHTPLLEDKLLKRCIFESSLLCMEHQCQQMKGRGAKETVMGTPEGGREEGQSAPLAVKEGSMHVSTEAIRHTELIKG